MEPAGSRLATKRGLSQRSLPSSIEGMSANGRDNDLAGVIITWVKRAFGHGENNHTLEVARGNF